MTLLEIKTTAANYLDTTVADLTVNGIDLFLVAVNQVRRQAELLHNFEFSRSLVTVFVDGVTGGSLNDTLFFGTDSPAEIKAVIEVGLFDNNNNFLPVEWTTVAESLERQRNNNPFYLARSTRYPTDGDLLSPEGLPRFTFAGDKIYRFPKCQGETFALGIEAYIFHEDWTGAQIADELYEDSPWTTKGSQYLLWQSIIHLNHLLKEFVFRQEGNLAPPQALADAGLEAFRQWDIFKLEQFRRHG